MSTNLTPNAQRPFLESPFHGNSTVVQFPCRTTRIGTSGLTPSQPGQRGDF